MPSLRAEARDRAVDGAVGDVETQPLEHAGPEAVEDDVRAVAQLLCLGEAWTLEIELDDLLAGVDRLVPCGRADAHGLASGRLDLDDARAQPHQLAARVRAWQLPREVDDEVTGERLHARRTYHYASRVD